MSIGVGIFLMVLGAILAFAVEATTPGINLNTLGIILLLTGLIAVLYSLLFWSKLSPWGRHRAVARRRSGRGGGPATFRPVKRSKKPSWHGQWRTPSAIRGTTAHERCVHTWLYARSVVGSARINRHRSCGSG